MFKLMLLGQWHGLSDTQLHALKVRLDFMVFTGSEPGHGSFPDATNICRFRNRLVTAKLDQVLLRRVNVQLEGKGLKVAGSRGAIIDATIIESAARPNQHIEVADCCVPCDHVPARSWALFKAGDVLRELIRTLKAEQSVIKAA